ncbi:MAG: hypothetical protein A3J83_08735 [Elusimicrobia bacterium RIFOXYA2_FULL_40_6]|nr:MAG: hypothetical protein A3J83_08735 [Elusimicrobia bacterium RIFOXYA2_FULL_40_6]
MENKILFLFLLLMIVAGHVKAQESVDLSTPAVEKSAEPVIEQIVEPVQVISTSTVTSEIPEPVVLHETSTDTYTEDELDLIFLEEENAQGNQFPEESEIKEVDYIFGVLNGYNYFSIAYPGVSFFQFKHGGSDFAGKINQMGTLDFEGNTSIYIAKKISRAVFFGIESYQLEGNTQLYQFDSKTNDFNAEITGNCNIKLNATLLDFIFHDESSYLWYIFSFGNFSASNNTQLTIDVTPNGTSSRSVTVYNDETHSSGAGYGLSLGVRTEIPLNDNVSVILGIIGLYTDTINLKDPETGFADEIYFRGAGANVGLVLKF